MDALTTPEGASVRPAGTEAPVVLPLGLDLPGLFPPILRKRDAKPPKRLNMSRRSRDRDTRAAFSGALSLTEGEELPMPPVAVPRRVPWRRCVWAEGRALVLGAVRVAVMGGGGGSRCGSGWGWGWSCGGDGGRWILAGGRRGPGVLMTSSPDVGRLVGVVRCRGDVSGNGDLDRGTETDGGEGGENRPRWRRRLPETTDCQGRGDSSSSLPSSSLAPIAGGERLEAVQAGPGLTVTSAMEGRERTAGSCLVL